MTQATLINFGERPGPVSRGRRGDILCRKLEAVILRIREIKAEPLPTGPGPSEEGGFLSFDSIAGGLITIGGRC